MNKIHEINKKTDINKVKEINEIENNLLETVVSQALVVRGKFGDIQLLKRDLVDRYPHIKLVYQKASVNKLLITEEGSA